MTSPLGSVGSLDPGLASIGLPPGEVIDALVAGVVRIRRRAELYEADGVTPFDISNWDARLTGGSITVDRDRSERRMCDLTFENEDNSLDLDAVQGFWYDKIVKVFWGIRYYNPLGQLSFWETQVGEFMIDRISEGRFPHVVKVTGRDYTKKCLNTKLKSSLQFPRDTPIETIISALAANSGIKKMRLPYIGLAYEKDIVFERGANRWEVMTQVADTIGYEVYFTPDGYLTMRPYPDPTYSPVKWVFRGGEPDGTLVEYERSSNDSRIKNKIIVIGATTEVEGYSTTVYAEASNNDPQSPTRIDRIGERTEIIEADYFTSNGQAQAFANSRLAISALEEYEVNFSSLLLPWLEAGDIVDIEDGDDNPYVPTRFLLSNYTLPLGLGTMSGTGRRITLIGVTENLEI